MRTPEYEVKIRDFEKAVDYIVAFGLVFLTIMSFMGY